MSKLFVSEPQNDSKIRCPYCKGDMNLLGPEDKVKKKMRKRGMKIAEEMKDTKFPLYLCKDEDCGGIFINELITVGLPLIKPGIYEEKD